MERSNDLANRLKEVLLDGHWIANTNYMEQLENVTMEQATHKTGTLNTIASLVFHMNYYLGGVLNVFKGGELEIHDKYSFDLPSMNSDSGWTYLVKEFLSNSEEFITQVSGIPNHKLDEIFLDEKYGTWIRNIEGTIEHAYYHLGQIVLIKKLIGI